LRTNKLRGTLTEIPEHVPGTVKTNKYIALSRLREKPEPLTEFEKMMKEVQEKNE